MNIETLIKDDRGLEMVLHLHKVSDDKIVYTYQSLLYYVDRVGIDEAYKQYQKQKEVKND